MATDKAAGNSAEHTAEHIDTEHTEPERGSARSRLGSRLPGGPVTLVLAAVMGLDAADQATIGATAPEVRDALHVSQTLIGAIATSSTLVGVVLTIPFGILADRKSRIGLLRVVIALWVLATISVGAAANYPVMLLSHCVLGLVTGAVAPAIASIVGDVVPREKRGRVYSVLLLGELVGAAIGTGASGEVAALIGWRWAFWLLALLGSGVLVAVLRTTEPVRQTARRMRKGKETVGDDANISLWQAIVILVRIRTNVVLVAASALGYFYFTGVQTFAVSLWTEGYGVSRTLAPVFTLLVGVALAVGVVIGGPLGDKLLLRGYKSGRVTAVLIAFGGCVIFLVPALATVKLAITLPLLLLAGMTLGSANPPLDATRIDIVPPRLLGRAESLRNAVRDGADAAAPLLFGVLGTAIGLRHTFLVLTGVLVLAGLLGLIAFKTYAGDAAAVARSDPPPSGKAYVTPEPGAG